MGLGRWPTISVGLAKLRVDQTGRIQGKSKNVFFFTSPIVILVIDRNINQNRNVRNFDKKIFIKKKKNISEIFATDAYVRN